MFRHHIIKTVKPHVNYLQIFALGPLVVIYTRQRVRSPNCRSTKFKAQDYPTRNTPLVSRSKLNIFLPIRNPSENPYSYKLRTLRTIIYSSIESRFRELVTISVRESFS